VDEYIKLNRDTRKAENARKSKDEPLPNCKKIDATLYFTVEAGKYKRNEILYLPTLAQRIENINSNFISQLRSLSRQGGLMEYQPFPEIRVDSTSFILSIVMPLMAKFRPHSDLDTYKVDPRKFDNPLDMLEMIYDVCHGLKNGILQALTNMTEGNSQTIKASSRNSLSAPFEQYSLLSHITLKFEANESKIEQDPISKELF